MDGRITGGTHASTMNSSCPSCLRVKNNFTSVVAILSGSLMIGGHMQEGANKFDKSNGGILNPV